MKYHLTEILDIDELKRLCENFTNINGTVTAILDLDGNVLVSTGWQSICTQFHRINSQTKCLCTESDTILAGLLKQGQKYNVYKCKNGLVDVAMPIIIGENHVGNFFTGQFFLEKPDIGFFRNQAQKYNFDETDYLSALKKAPIFSEDQIKASISFLVQLTETIGSIGLKNIYSLELTKQLETEKEHLKTINDEYAALNEEYKTQNDELQQAKERAEKSGHNLVSKNEELKQTVQQLFELDNRLQFSLTAGKLGTWDWDIQSGRLNWSETCKEMFGIPLDIEMKYEHFLNAIIPEDREVTNAITWEALNEKKDYNFEYRVLWPGDTLHWISAMGRGIYDKSGKPVRMIGVAMDITDRKHAEIGLAHSHALMSYIIEHSQSSIAVFDKEMRYIFVSQSYLRDYKVKDPNIIGKHHYDVFPGLPQKFKDAHQKALYGEISSADDDPYYLEGEIVSWSRWECRPWYQADETIGGIIIYAEDITERIQQKNELIAAKEKAEESDRLKTAFLQNMSHEIRTPMNAIMGFSSLLKSHFNDKQKLEQFSDIINQRCNDLLDIINDILDVAKIESGQVSVNIEECSLPELLRELTTFFTEYQKRINKQHINFNLLAPGNQVENIITTDKVKLKQIFINLITNAFKFTDEGKIEGGYTFDENHNLVFYVSDTGIGIPPDKQKLVFERFSQLNQNPKKNIGGTGLGLPIVKGLVNLLGGEMFLESQPGKGSTFSFTISYKPVQHLNHQPSEIEIPSIKNATDKTILIVEDDLYNAEYLKVVLSGIGLNILQAETGEEAVKISINQAVDLILMDIRLPGIDGYEATRQIHHHKPNQIIVAQTAYASFNEKQKALEAGCIDYISKPTKKDLLLPMISKHLPK